MIGEGGRTPSGPASRPMAGGVAGPLAAGLLAGVAFLLGCGSLFDADFWWHLGSGEWILANGRVPRLDPFTFASADRPWVDLHWGFQVAIARVYRAGGVRGAVLFASAVASSAFLVAFAGRPKGCPRIVAAWCWAPALVVMSSRLDPRPEILSLLLLAAYLAVLSRAGRSPAIVWLLPPVQATWANVHSLFVLGPVVLGCFLADRPARGALGTLRGPAGRAWWRHVGPASVLAVLACWLNPYGLRGVLFPAELFAKMSSAGAYKSYIAELMELRSMVEQQTLALAAGNLYLRATTFLLLLLPWAFLIPAAWGRSRPESRARAGSWTAAMLAGVAVAAVGALGLPARGMPAWAAGAGRLSPLLCAVPFGIAAVAGSARSRGALLLLILGIVAVAGWQDSLRGHLFGDPASLAGARWSSLRPVEAALAAVALGLAARAGASPFLILLALAFGQLALMAHRNMSLFGLVAGSVLASTLGEWAGQLLRQARGPGPAPGPSGWGRAGSWGLVALLLAWMVAIPADAFYAMTGELRHFGWGERPYYYAHEAARFAGRAGMPGRALVFDLGQTGVYLYHNGPGRKLFMDARLEVPRPETFETYTRVERRLQEGDPRWAEDVRRMGDPLILVGLEGNADAAATLLADRRRRCAWFDPVAAVFLPAAPLRPGADFPAVDFMGRFLRTFEAGPGDPTAALVEAKGLAEVGGILSRRPGADWALRLPILLLGSRRARAVLEASADSPQAWTILGHCCWALAPDLGRPPPDRDAPWDAATGLSWGQAASCYRWAAAGGRDNLPALLSLARLYEVRRMADARAAVAARIRALGAGPIEPGGRTLESLAGAVGGPDEPLPWAEADRRAVASLGLGEPERALRIWARALGPPSPALRASRVADANLAALGFGNAERSAREALALDPTLGSAWFALAFALLHQGRPQEAREACRAGLATPTTRPQRAILEQLDRSLARP